MKQFVTFFWNEDLSRKPAALYLLSAFIQGWTKKNSKWCDHFHSIGEKVSLKDSVIKMNETEIILEEDIQKKQQTHTHNI